jgi:hypothetical protein
VSTLQEGVFAPMAPRHQLPIREACFSSMRRLRTRMEGGPKQECRCPKTWEESKMSGVELPQFIRANE